MAQNFVSSTLVYIVLLGAILFAYGIFSTIVTNLLVRVPFVPTSRRITRHIIGLANIAKTDKVYDLGCGDGRFLAEAQKHTDTKVTGYESAILPFFLAKIRQFLSGENMEILRKNFFKGSLNDADIIYCYLSPEVMQQVGQKFMQECRTGTRLYSHTFSIKDIEPAKIWPRNKNKRLPTIYMYQK